MKILCWLFGHKIGGVVDTMDTDDEVHSEPDPWSLGPLAADDYFVVENVDDGPPPQFSCARCGHLWDTTYDEIESKTDFIGRYP